LPANIVISNPTIQLSVIRALRHSVGLNASTAFEMASMPVMAVQPDANARNTRSTDLAQRFQLALIEDGKHRIRTRGAREGLLTGRRSRGLLTHA
jgi:hypothetical protein